MTDFIMGFVIGAALMGCVWISVDSYGDRKACEAAGHTYLHGYCLDARKVKP